MRTSRLALVSLAAILLLAGCGGGGPAGPTIRYYDPQGLFTAEFPAANTFELIAPQALPDGTRLLSGVMSFPPQSSTPSAAAGIGGGLGASPTPQSSVLLYVVSALDVGTASSVDGFAHSLPSLPTGSDVRVSQQVPVGGRPGLLMVADQPNSGITDASGYVLVGHVGYWIQLLVPLGQWDASRDQFLQVLRAFHPGGPSTLSGLLLQRPAPLVRSRLNWPVG